MERDDTSIIVERMLGVDEIDVNLDDILGMLSIYFWWSDDWQSPEDYIDDLIADIPPHQLPAVIEILHGELPICQNAQDQNGKCEKSAEDCFNDYLEFYGTDGSELDIIELLDNIRYWSEYANVHSEDEKGPLRQLYERFVVDKLSENGATDIEIGNALQVIEIEEDRRRLASDNKLRNIYRSFRLAGGSFEEFMKNQMVERFTGEAFKLIASEYEDISEDMPVSDEDKRKIVIRYLEEHEDFYGLLEVNFQKYEYGMLPPYINRFCEAGSTVNE